MQIGFYLIAAVLFLRLVQIQVFGHEKYTKLAEEQYLAWQVQKAQRGLIFDRNHKSLALSNSSFDISVDKRMIDNPEKLSRKLAVVLKKSSSEIVNKIKKGNNSVILERKIDQKQATMIKVMNLHGVKIVESTERVYPFKEKLAQVLGFVDIDGNGLSGIELRFNEHLTGEDGWRILQKDARGKKILPISSSTEDPKDGDDVILTID
ncbi:stage V sporulation protein D, partial [candidate division KSB1 bacterium]|nr:stage V sporulation protein D [candidate division KSB1 bacterium]